MISWILNRIRINLQMTSQSVRNKSLLENFFKGLSLYLEARIWIRIRIRVKKSDPHSASASNKNLDPHQMKMRIRIRIR